MKKWVVYRDTGRGDIFADEFDTREAAETELWYIEGHKEDFQVAGRNASVWMEEEEA